VAMLYPELFKSLEQVRWNMDTDIPWDQFDASKLTPEQAQTIKMNAITEWAALPATEMFLRDNRTDSDFCAFMSVWFFEEQKHSLVLMEYLRRFYPDLVPTEEELDKVRFEFDPAPPLETLMLHFCGEIRLNHWYRCASDWHTEPVIKQIYKMISQDEARHGGAYLRYMKKALSEVGDVASASFAKIGVLMASSRRTDKPLHPTNLHVNQALFPNDTIQSRLPDPEWLERWLDGQIKFDEIWEKKVVDRILHNLSLLFDRSFATVQDLNRYRKEISARLSTGVTFRDKSNPVSRTQAVIRCCQFFTADTGLHSVFPRHHHQPPAQVGIFRGNPMKIFKIVALLIAVSAMVVGCGGATNAKIGGTVVGLASGNSVGLTNNGSDTITYTFSSSSNSFTFDRSVGSGGPYVVTVTSQPTGQVCSVTNGSGTVTSSGSDVTNVLVTCTTGTGTTVPLTASIGNLAAGVTLQITDGNGGAGTAGVLSVTGTTTSATSTISANFPFNLAPGSIYNAVITSTVGQTCTILNTSGAGTIPATGSPSPIAVSCI